MFTAALIALVGTALVGTASAAELSVDVPILRIEGAEIYIGLGRYDGLKRGEAVEVFRVVEVRAPGADGVLSDRFLAGTATVVEVGETLSLVRAAPEVVIRLKVGDRVRFQSTSSESVSYTPPTDAGGEKVEVVERTDPETEALRSAFQLSAGGTPLQKIALWEAFLDDWPQGILSEAVERELAALARHRELVDAASAPTLDDARLVAVGPSSAPEDEPIPVTLVVDRAELVRGATLNYRRIGEETYRSVTMAPRGDTAFGAAIPAEAAVVPGVEWFVAVGDEGGEARYARDTATAPAQVVIEEDPLDIVHGERSQVSIFYEYVDFYQLEGADQFHHFETDFLYRIFSPLYSVRVGYGIYNGVSGDPDAIESNKGSYDDVTEPVGYNFGYTELEFRINEWLALIGRGIVGVDREGLASGAQGRIRLGPESGTNLLAGAAKVGNVGSDYLLQLSWDTVERIPMSAGVHVTNQPGISQDDFGVRLVYEARYEVTEWVELGGRVGYQLRNINHTGPSFGATTVFSW